MMRTGHDRAVRPRRELARDQRSGRVRVASDAERRLAARAARDGAITAEVFGPSDPRYAYLTRTYD
jgi:hypothetical protein